MKTETIEVWVYQSGLSREKKPNFYVSDVKFVSAPEGWAFVAGPLQLKFDWPEGYDPVKVAVNALNAELVKAREAFAERTRELNAQIQQLLAIEYTPEPAFKDFVND